MERSQYICNYEYYTGIDAGEGGALFNLWHELLTLEAKLIESIDCRG